MSRDKEAIRAKVNDLLGHGGKDGTYYYCLTRCKSAFGYGTMTFDDFVEVDEEFTEQFVDLFEKEIESLRAELKQTKEDAYHLSRNSMSVYKKITKQLEQAQQEADKWEIRAHDAEERAQKAEQANAALLEGLREVVSEMQPIVESRYSFVGAAIKAIQDDAIELLAKYDTAQPITATVHMDPNASEETKQAMSEMIKVAWETFGGGPIMPLENTSEVQRLREALEKQEKVELWVCPDCAFAFDAVHEDVDGGHSCPHCATIRLSEALNHIHKCSKSELDNLTYESQRKDWEEIYLTADAALSPQKGETLND